MALEIRTITDEEIPAYRGAMVTTFGDESDQDPEGPARVRALVATPQLWAAFDGPTVVATAGTFDHTIVVPGGTLPMAGLTMVTVRPTHRRRGILRELMRLHLEDARARGFSISGLWASEATIYGRFGYGVAAEADAIEIGNTPTLRLAGTPELDALSWLEEARAREVLPGVYARAIANRPGALLRSATWWRERRFIEAPFARAGASRRRHVLASRDGEPVGYLVFRQRGAFVDGLANGKVEIIELIAIDARAEATLWQLALGVDLFPTVTWSNAPTDDVLAWMVTDARSVRRRRTDNLWLRVEDPGTALAARTYAADGCLRFAVDETAWELVVERGRGRCAPTTRAPELRMTRPALGAIYLGGIAPSRLARTRAIAGDPAALALADRMLASAIAPWCPEVF